MPFDETPEYLWLLMEIEYKQDNLLENSDYTKNEILVDFYDYKKDATDYMITLARQNPDKRYTIKQI